MWLRKRKQEARTRSLGSRESASVKTDQLKDSLMDQVVKFYLNGDDFNGLTILAKDPTPDEMWQVIEELVTDGEIQVVTNGDFPNPHIRPWASRRTNADQIESVELIRSGNNAIEEDRVCLYPTPRAMLGRLDHHLFVDEPYRRELAKGNGDLELRYFTFDATRERSATASRGSLLLADHHLAPPT